MLGIRIARACFPWHAKGMPLLMRIGSWNLHGRWSDEHAKFLERLDCNVWLLTEVRTDVHLAGSHQVVTKALMTQDRHWSAMLSRPGLEERDDRTRAPQRPSLKALPPDQQPDLQRSCLLYTSPSPRD